jgi:hypothetical protein
MTKFLAIGITVVKLTRFSKKPQTPAPALETFNEVFSWQLPYLSRQLQLEQSGEDFRGGELRLQPFYQLSM